jgi:flagellar motility protein MotE (MotC chaperone)
MTQMRLSGLFIIIFLLFGTDVISANDAQSTPPIPAVQAQDASPQTPISSNAPVNQTNKSIPADMPPTQANSKTSVEEVVTVAHTVVATAEYVGVILAIFLGFVGATNIFDARRNRDKMRRLGVQFRKLKEQYRKLKEDKNAIEDALEEFRQHRADILNDVAELREQEGTLRTSSETALKDLTELREQEKTLRKLAETLEKSSRGLADTVQNVVIVRSPQLGDETRLKALQQLAQQVDPLGIAPLLEILTDSENDIKLRIEAAYGLGRYSENSAFEEYYEEIFSGFREVLGAPETPQELVLEAIKSATQLQLEVLKNSTSNIRLRLDAARELGQYSENPAFKEHYPEIFSGFLEVLANQETPKALALETIRSARRFGSIPDELASLFKKWEQNDAQAGPAEG